MGMGEGEREGESVNSGNFIAIGFGGRIFLQLHCTALHTHIHKLTAHPFPRFLTHCFGLSQERQIHGKERDALLATLFCASASIGLARERAFGEGCR